MYDVTVDGVCVQVPEGATILDAAEVAGIRIPTLCYLKNVSAIGSCRVCVVDVMGVDRPVPACSTAAEDGMAVVTQSRWLTGYRRIALELIVADLEAEAADDLFAAPRGDESELKLLCDEYDVSKPALAPARVREPIVGGNPFLTYDPNLCIACERCVGACNNAARNHTLQAGKRGVRTIIEAPFGSDWRETSCESCGTCAQACPTGALKSKRRAAYYTGDTTNVLTTCPHCGVGCQLNLVVEDGRIVDSQGAPGPSNKSLLCVKGRFASYDFVDAPDRIRTPLVKNPDSGEFEAATWDEALDVVASRFAELRDAYGGESLAAFACSRSTNEDIYLFQKMARTALRTNTIDNCARV